MGTRKLAMAGLAAGAMLAAFPAGAADTSERRIDRYQHRIDTGWREGDLTGHEARRLDRALDHARRDRAHYLADGTLDARERHRLDRELDAVGRAIAHERHDRERRTYGVPVPAASGSYGPAYGHPVRRDGRYEERPSYMASPGTAAGVATAPPARGGSYNASQPRAHR